MDLIVRRRNSGAPGSQEIEVVERKGVGHPDTICDAVAEAVCVALCRYYLQRFGRILHHNVDKVLLVGGAARPSFGGGDVKTPMELYLAGRATREYQGEQIPVEEIATEACRNWFKATLRAVDVDRHLRIFPRVRPGSGDLTSMFDSGGNVPRSNDTSCGAGFAPLTDLERVVLEVERHLNSPQVKIAHPEIGLDIKVMGVRRQGRIDLTIGCAFVDRFVRDMNDYVEKKARAAALALDAARRSTRLEVTATLNAADDLGKGSVFLTITGTSAEAGDDGQTGRGNRTSGLITPYRTMTMEAAAGKNPLTHVGKLYSVLARRIAESTVATVPSVVNAECVLVSQIGRRVDDPAVVDLCVNCDDRDAQPDRHLVAAAVEGELARLPDIRAALLDGHIQLF